jgi:hypothetical protein
LSVPQIGYFLAGWMPYMYRLYPLFKVTSESFRVKVKPIFMNSYNILRSYNISQTYGMHFANSHLKKEIRHDSGVFHVTQKKITYSHTGIASYPHIAGDDSIQDGA